jgi:hypothetical protein
MNTFLRWILCKLRMCPGKIDYDDISVYWKCNICGKLNRAKPWCDNMSQLRMDNYNGAGDRGTRCGEIHPLINP